MANENELNDITWSKTPTLKKIRIGSQDYWLKDDEARTVIAQVSSAVVVVEGSVSNHETRIGNLEARGRYLSTWDVSTGLPGDYPVVPSTETGLSYTYTFKAGDYYIISNIPSTGTKYMPDGVSITATRASTSAEWIWTVGKKEYTGSSALVVGGQFLYSTTGWNYVATAKDVAWGNITGNLSAQTDLQTALDAKASSVYVDEKVAAEASARIAADASLQAAISAEVSARASAISTLDSTVVHLAGPEVITGNKFFMGTITAGRIEATGTLSIPANISVAGTDIRLTASGSNGLAIKATNGPVKIEGSGVTVNGSLTVNGSGSLAKDVFINGIKVPVALSTVDSNFALDTDIKIQKITVGGSEVTPGEDKDVALGNLAGKDSASGTVPGQTITGVKAAGSSTGEIAVTLSQTSTAIESTGSIVATGTVSVELQNTEFSKVTTIGTLPSIDTNKFSGGSLAAAGTDTFVKEGIVATVGSDETLVFSAASTATAVTAQGAFTPATINTGFFNAGAMPTFNTSRVSVKSATFTGSSVAVSVSGAYDKASVNTATFTGKPIELNVGEITVAAKDVTVE